MNRWRDADPLRDQNNAALGEELEMGGIAVGPSRPALETPAQPAEARGVRLRLEPRPDTDGRGNRLGRVGGDGLVPGPATGKEEHDGPSRQRSAHLAEDAAREEHHEDEGARTGSERDKRQGQRDADIEVAFVHPRALSTTVTSNGCPPRGVIVKRTAQWPTMTSAGADLT